MPYCHFCNNPIYANNVVEGDMGTKYHPLCFEVEKKKEGDVETMRTYYNVNRSVKEKENKRKNKK